MAAPLAPDRRGAAAVVVGVLAALTFGSGGAGLQARPPFGPQERASAAPTRILFDEAHHNLFASAASGYLSVVRLVTDEGFSVTVNRAPFDAARLAAADILLILTTSRHGNTKTRKEEATKIRKRETRRSNS